MCKWLGMRKSLVCSGNCNSPVAVMEYEVKKVRRAMSQRVGITCQEEEIFFPRESLIDFKLGSGQTSYCCPEEILLAESQDF